MQNGLGVFITYEKRICQRSVDSNIKLIQMSTPSFLLMGWRMEDYERLRIEYQIAIIQHQNHMIDMSLFMANRNRRRRGQRRRAIWVKPWIGRRLEFGIYDQLTMELRNEDPASFTNFLLMPPDMFDELLDRVGPRITYTVQGVP